MDKWASARLAPSSCNAFRIRSNWPARKPIIFWLFCSIHKSWKLLALAWQCQLRKEGSMVMSFKNFPIMVSCDGRSCKWRKNSIFILTYKVRDWKAQTIYTSRDLRSHWLPKVLGTSILWTKVEFAFLIIQSRDESSEWGSTPKNIKNDSNDDNIRFCSTNCSVLIMAFPGWDQASEWGCFTQRQGRQARTKMWRRILKKSFKTLCDSSIATSQKDIEMLRKW